VGLVSEVERMGGSGEGEKKCRSPSWTPGAYCVGEGWLVKAVGVLIRNIYPFHTPFTCVTCMYV